MSINNSRLALMTICIVSCLGCGNSDDVRVYPVQGTIRVEGKAMPGGGSISFIPLEGQVGKTAGGQIEENGRYVLSTYGNGDGCMTGYFRVVITQSVTVEPREPIPDGVKPPVDGNQGMSVPQEEFIPMTYSDSQKSPLKATVEPRSNEINFDLQRKLEPADGTPQPFVARRSDGRTSTQLASARGRNAAAFFGSRGFAQKRGLTHSR